MPPTIQDWIAITLGIVLMGIIAVFMWHYSQQKNKPAKSLYDIFDPYANIAKIILQMAIGVRLVLFVFIKLYYARGVHTNIPFVSYIIDTFKLTELTALDIVARALGYATAVELAYTLFTDGPDEAINPLITGVATVVLLGLGHASSLDINSAIAVGLYAIAIAGLFIIKNKFIDKKKGPQTKKKKKKKARISIQ